MVIIEKYAVHHAYGRVFHYFFAIQDVSQSYADTVLAEVLTKPKAYHYTQSRANSINVPSSKSISLRTALKVLGSCDRAS